MRLTYCAGIAVVMMSLAPAASAFTVNQTSSSKANAANFQDPDDNVPFPHVSDDGQQVNQFQDQQQPVDNYHSDDAFERAKERMQQ